MTFILAMTHQADMPGTKFLCHAQSSLLYLFKLNSHFVRPWLQSLRRFSPLRLTSDPFSLIHWKIIYATAKSKKTGKWYVSHASNFPLQWLTGLGYRCMSQFGMGKGCCHCFKNMPSITIYGNNHACLKYSNVHLHEYNSPSTIVHNNRRHSFCLW